MYGLHNKYNIVQNDCRIDNIGITPKGDFALFDFDGSVNVGERDIYSKRDYDTLVESLQNITENTNIVNTIFRPSNSTNLMVELVKYLGKQDNSYNEAYTYLENLSIIY